MTHTTPWQLDSQKVKVCEDNDHLGQILSGARQEEKNVDLRIKKGRNNMLGPVCSFKCPFLYPAAYINIPQKNIPDIHFLLGELPMEAKLHRDIFALFVCFWTNPDSKIYQIVKYLLDNSLENSMSLSLHFRHLYEKY